jgi:hypothetical protein
MHTHSIMFRGWGLLAPVVLVLLRAAQGLGPEENSPSPPYRQ